MSRLSRRWPKYVTAAVALFLVASFAVDAGIRLALPTSPALQSHAATAPAAGAEHRLIVFLTGFQSSGVALSVHHLPLWQQYGDVLVVEYPHWRFSASDVVVAVTNYVARNLGARAPPHYTRLTLIGASLGGLLADDIIVTLGDRTGIARRDVILIDAPTGGSDLADTSQAWLTHLPVGPTYGTVLARKKVRDRFNAGVRANPLGPDADQAQEAELHRQALRYEPSALNDQGGYIFRHSIPRFTAAHNGVRAVFLQSEYDTTVEPIAYTHWKKAYPDLPLIPVHSTHIEFLGYPGAWSMAFIEAFRRLG